MKAHFIFLTLILILAACGGDKKEQNDNTQPGGSDFVVGENLPVRPEDLPEKMVEDVIDGDTVELRDGTRVRLIGINTPEREQPYYDEATAYTRSLLEGKMVGIEMDVEERDQFDRTLAYLWIGDKLANYEIVRAGFANSLSIQPNIKYESYITQAEEKAIAETKGIWQQGQASLAVDFVQYDPPGADDEVMNEEYVRLYNSSSVEINLAGYTVGDDSRNVYTFGDMVLKPNERVTIFSGCGVDQPPSRLYWCSQTPIWNNSGDTVYVYNAQGQLLDREVLAGR